MFKVGQTVSIDEVWAAGWMFDTLDGKTKAMSFVNDDETLGVEFAANEKTAVVCEYVRRW